jgi:hypothetical protein
MMEILQMLNQDKDRCVLIGRAAFNLLLGLKPPSDLLTNDVDVVCPDLAAANECAALLLENGFKQSNTVFSRPDYLELDVLVCDPSCPENVVGGFFNLPSLRILWDARERRKGCLVAGLDALVADKLIHARENDGKDLESVSVVFKIRPHYLEHFLKSVLPKQAAEDRDAMLYSLYSSLSGDEKAKSVIEGVMLSDLEGADSSGPKPA